MNVKFPGFAEFFRAVHGFEPYAWQIAAADYVDSTGRVPDRVAVPTGLGKTSMVDVVVWALARDAVAGVRRLGQRIFLLTERRIIVDGAGAHVAALAAALAGADRDPQAGPVSAVAAGLRSLCGPGDDEAFPLRVATFHGSRREDAASWISVHGPTVIATTATQYTLRLAGRAPGVSSSMAPVHAGLVGVDATVLFDEPHLAAPQVFAISQALAVQSRFEVPGVPAARMCVLGATIPPGLRTPDAGAVISFDESAETPAALVRHRASKPAYVTVCAATRDAVIKAAVAQAVDQVRAREGSSGCRIAVVVNTVDAARKVSEGIAKKLGKRSAVKVRTVTGRLRGADRPIAVDLGRENEVLVATQVVEAGADFSVDCLITELAPWSSLTQRFGRCNRDGLAADPVLHLIVPMSHEKKGVVYGDKADRAIYGEGPIAAAGEIAVNLEDGTDLAPGRIGAVAAASGVAEAALWPPLATPAHIDDEIASMALSTTTSAIDASTWLSGVDPVDARPDPVTVVWREPARGSVAPVDVAGYGDGKSVKSRKNDKFEHEQAVRHARAAGLAATMIAAPPVAAETVEVPIQEARALLATMSNSQVPDATGLDAVAWEVKAENWKFAAPAAVMRADGWRPVDSIWAVRPGDVLVIDAHYGGYRRDFGVDVRSRVRVADLGLATWAASGDLRRPIALSAEGLRAAGMSAAGAAELLDALCDESVRRSVRVTAATDALGELLGRKVAVIRHGGLWCVVGKTSPLASGSGGGAGGGSVMPVTLDDHHLQVGDETMDSAVAAGLAVPETGQLMLAAQTHDLGKLEPAFQALLGADLTGPALAKSLPRARGARGKLAALRADAGADVGVAALPKAFRHELVSARALEAAMGSAVDDFDLAVWSVMAHHGRVRGTHFARMDTAGAIDRRRRLERVYGPWGLAWLETLLRLADHRASAAPVAQDPARNEIGVDGFSPGAVMARRAVAGLDAVVIPGLGGVDHPGGPGDGGDAASPRDTAPRRDAVPAGRGFAESLRDDARHKIRLTGLSGTSINCDTLAAYGALYAVSFDDPGATLRWDGAVPVLFTILGDGDGSVAPVVEASETMAGAFGSVADLLSRTFGGKHPRERFQRFNWDDSKAVVKGVSPEMLRRFAAEIAPGLDARQRFIASGLVAPHLRRTGKASGASSLNMPLGIQHSNGSVLHAGAPLTGPASAETLLDSQAGWDHDAKDTGRLDCADQAVAQELPSRGGAGILILLGGMLPVASDMRGPGRAEHLPRDLRVLPRPGFQVSAAALQEMLRAPHRVGDRCETTLVNEDKMFYGAGEVLG